MMTAEQENDLETRIGNLLFVLEEESPLWNEDAIYDLKDLLRLIRRGVISYEAACDRIAELAT